MLWEHTRTKPFSFKRTHSSQFHKSLSSSLRLFFLYFRHIFLSRAPQTPTHSSQAPFKLFPVRNQHIHCSSFKWTHSRQFQSCPVCASIIFFVFSTRFHLKHRRHGFCRTQNPSRLNLHIPNQGCQVFTSNQPNCYSKLAQSHFEGGGGFPGLPR